MIPDDTEVWVTTGTGTEPICGTITTETCAPRSYQVDISNRSHIRVVPETGMPTSETAPNAPGTIMDDPNSSSSSPPTSPCQTVTKPEQ